VPKGVMHKPGQKVPRVVMPRFARPPGFLRWLTDRLVRCTACGGPLGYLPWEYCHQRWQHADCRAAVLMEYLGEV
jgi:hypothetical protein